MTLTERWQNVYPVEGNLFWWEVDSIYGTFHNTKEEADRAVGTGDRTHYLKTFWLDGVICTDPGPELIEIKKD